MQDQQQFAEYDRRVKTARDRLKNILHPASEMTIAPLVERAVKESVPQHGYPETVTQGQVTTQQHALMSRRDEYPEAQVLWNKTALSHFVARRSGLDFVADGVTKDEILASRTEVTVSVIHGDAKLPSTYSGVNALLQNSPVDLVIVDPPFGERKHARGETWDSEANRWEPTSDLLDYLAPVNLNKQCLVIAVYTRYQDVGAWITALEPGNDSTGGEARGNVLFTLMRDGPTHMRAGTASPGARTFLLAMKYGNGAEAVRADESRLGGRFWYSFPRPEATSKYGRMDIDAELRHEGASVNPTQKSVEETRMLVRTLCPGGGAVLSLCNGTGTALVASCLEGRMSVGIDSSKRQCEWCRRRLQVFASRELMLAGALADGMDPRSASFKVLNDAALMTSLPDLQVSQKTSHCNAKAISTGHEPYCIEWDATRVLWTIHRGGGRMGPRRTCQRAHR